MYLLSEAQLSQTTLKVFPEPVFHGNFAEYRTGEHIHRKSRCDRIKAHHREHHESTHSTAILVTGFAQQVVAEPHINESASVFLCEPRLSGIAEQVWNNSARLVAHRELPYKGGMVRIRAIEIVLTTFDFFFENVSKKIIAEPLISSVETNAVGNVVRDLPSVYPSVVLVVGLTETIAAVPCVVKRLDERVPCCPLDERSGWCR